MTTEVDLTQLHCPMSYTQYSFLLDQGAFKPCCTAIKYPFNADLFNELGDDYFTKHPRLINRKISLLNNIKHDDCRECWDREQLHNTSVRITTLKNGADSFVTNDRGIDPATSKINKLELLLSNMCNLGCFMCVPHSSSTIEKIYTRDERFAQQQKLNATSHNEFVTLYKEKFANSAMALIKKTIQDSTIPDCKISYLGGEPSLHDGLDEQADKFIEWSKAVPNKKFSIEIFTNATSKPKLNQRFLNMFKKYKAAGWKTYLQVSIDAAYEYAQVRHGTDFAQVNENLIHFLKEDSIDVLAPGAIVSNLSLPYIDVLAKYLSTTIKENYSGNKGIAISFILLANPNWMNISYLPKKYAKDPAERAANELQSLREKFTEITVNFEYVRQIHSRLSDVVEPERIMKFFEKLHEKQDLYRKTYPDWNFYNVFPHLNFLAEEYNINRIL